MSSLKSRRAKKVCAAKIVYPSAEAAWKAARAQGTLYRAYRCVGLRGQQAHWHVTSGGR